MSDPDRPHRSARRRNSNGSRQSTPALSSISTAVRPSSSDEQDNLAPGLERFIGREDIFRHLANPVRRPRGAAHDGMPAAFAQGRDLGADPRSENTGNNGRSGHSGGLKPVLLRFTCGQESHDEKETSSRTGRAVKAGRQLITLPGMTSMTDPTPAVPKTKTGDSEPERPTDEVTKNSPDGKGCIPMARRPNSAHRHHPASPLKAERRFLRFVQVGRGDHCSHSPLAFQSMDPV